jgi:hypothetical protein
MLTAAVGYKSAGVFEMSEPKRPRRLLVTLGVGATLLTLVLLGYVLSPVGRVRMVLGSRTLALLDRANRVQAYQIDPNWVQNPRGPVIGQNRLTANGAEFKGFVIVGSGQEQGRDAAAVLISLLRDARTYGGSRKTCDFSPVVAYRLRAGDETLELLLDFTCGRLQLLTRDGHGQATHSVFGDFDHARAGLVALTRQTFPGNQGVLEAMEPAP